MNSKRRYFQIACLASISVLLGACSSSGELKTDTTPKVVAKSAPVVVAQKDNINKLFAKKAPAVVAKKVVKATPKIRPVIVAKAKPVARKAYVKPKTYVKPKAYVPPKPIVVAVHKVPTSKVYSRPVAKPVVKPKVVVHRPAAPAKWVKPVVVAQRVAPKRPVYVQPKAARVQQASYRPPAQVQRPVVTSKRYSQSRLTGDFASNYQAQAFIVMMSSRHGFNPSYTTGVLSKAKATAWLKRQAYSDANPKPKTKKSRPSNWSNYQKRFITSRHINAGTAFYNKYRRSLQRASAQYGVPEEYILGIMGVETIYGGNVGTDKAIDALATMSFMNSRRGTYFASELEAYLLMTRRTGLDPLQPKASWAGALGLPQFMPSNIKKYGVDYDGDGAVNLWTPHDAIGSIANYLSKHGWRRGEIAAIPARRTGGSGYSSLNSGFKYKHSLSTLARKGLKPSYPGVSGQVHMVKLRTNAGNEYWVGGNNFYVITRYNHSSFYAMAVHQLAQEIKKRVKPSSVRMPTVIEASRDKDLLLQAAHVLL
ncbi:lytic murein transglycosylase B [Leucothrix arctica]|uniref:Lytic murein transglycosylase B n=1 Tax=Leucothrix arctica TaxID=1481894 RepID=A0A317CH16_9GAMM|nr:lytic murein transglycosylase B [Leucothrix arctica]PWQ97421.1 lytic murein transglycosylase B [Leucothrix arctica]